MNPVRGGGEGKVIKRFNKIGLSLAKNIRRRRKQ